MSAPLRICFDLTPCEMRDRYGGFGRYGLSLLRHLLALPGPWLEGIEMLALARSDGRPVPVRDAVDAALAGGPIVPPSRHHRQRRLLVGRALRAAKIDLFHAITPTALPLAAPCPIVATVHDIIPVVCPEPGRGPVACYRRGRDRIQQRLHLWRADEYIAISATTRRDLIDVLGVVPERITVIHHGVDASVFTAQPLEEEGRRIRSRHRLPDRWFISVGSDHYRKNQWRLFEAWRRVSASIGEGLVLVGKALYYGTLRRIEEEARRAGLADRVRWVREIDDEELPALYRGATALVAPSLYEGFGMTLLEGMACGTPVVAARTDAHVEVGGDAALYFDPESVDDLEGLLLQIAGNGALGLDLRARGLERSRRFTWQKAAQETAGLYRRLLGARQG